MCPEVTEDTGGETPVEERAACHEGVAEVWVLFDLGNEVLVDIDFRSVEEN